MPEAWCNFEVVPYTWWLEGVAKFGCKRRLNAP
jgi:hypothetical protein